jgi:large subunit ribosomal protein L21
MNWRPVVSYTADPRAPSPRFHAMSSYAIISLGGKQYRVREGERLLVDRLREDEGATLEPRVLLVGGDGAPDLAPSATVTARVVGHELGEKIRIGKYRRRTGYKKHTGHRSRLTRIEIEAIGGKRATKAAAKPKAEKTEKAEPKQSDTAPAAKTETALPEGYASMTIAQLTEAAGGWSREQVEAALEHERSGKARKGALTALESALEEKN